MRHTVSDANVVIMLTVSNALIANLRYNEFLLNGLRDVRFVQNDVPIDL